MSAREDAGSHARKAREFLGAAGMEFEHELYRRGVLLGPRQHQRQGRDLPTAHRAHRKVRRPPVSRAGARRSGSRGQGLEVHLPSTTGPQDDGPVPGRTDATKAVEWATRMVDAARDATAT